MEQKKFNQFIADIASKKLEPAEKWESVQTVYKDVLYIYPAKDLDADYSFRLEVTFSRHPQLDDDHVFEKAILSDENSNEDAYELSEDEFKLIREILDV